MTECAYSHSAPDDPIVFFGQPGASHLHDFFGNESVDAHSTPQSLEDQPTTCEITQDRASYWAPALFDGSVKVDPVSSDAYYRPGPGVDGRELEPYAFGLRVVAGDARATESQPVGVVGWGCGPNPRLSTEPPTCGDSSGLRLHVIFPDCWDGDRLDSDDHRSHMAYSEAGECPGRHPVAVPQLEFVVRYPFSGDPSGLSLASGPPITAHADFYNAWEPAALATEIESCLARDVICG